MDPSHVLDNSMLIASGTICFEMWSAFPLSPCERSTGTGHNLASLDYLQYPAAAQNSRRSRHIWKI
jgi:hypothetical protein